MKKIILEKEDDNSTVYLLQVNILNPIFAKKNGRFAGMLVLEPKHGGWILKTGGECGATGHHPTIKNV